jgi:hypothetical protein
MHGGAPGSGAPRGNQNALKNGLHTRKAIEERRQLRALMRQSPMLIQKILAAFACQKSKASVGGAKRLPFIADVET